MNTPICDFVRTYSGRKPVRFHMPGHKGRPVDSAPDRMPIYASDITEVDGADVLYAARGCIRESEEHAGSLFGSARTLYSTEGSSLCIRAMLYLAAMDAKLQGRSPRIAAGRNAHRVFLETVALLDLDVEWLGSDGNLLRAEISTEKLECLFADPLTAPTAVYITSPDYLGNRTDLRPIAALCRRYDALLLVDNAHGAYLKFLENSEHPLDRGADLCCDSAHKTLPVLTGGAYLHAARDCPAELRGMMERAMALFAGTSPSWLILQEKGIICEFSDPDYVVLMVTPENTGEELECLLTALRDLPERVPIMIQAPVMGRTVPVLRPHEVLFRPFERVPAEESVGRILASPSVSCPPAVPIVRCGERIDEKALELFRYYGIDSCDVVKE